MNAKLIASNALASVIALGLIGPTAALAHEGPAPAQKEKCYGIAKAGANDCANLSNTHGCAGASEKANDPEEWSYAAKGTCVALGGMLEEQAIAAFKARAVKAPARPAPTR